MNIQQKIEQKKEQLQQLVEFHTKLLNDTNNLNVQILETNGALKELQELLEEQNNEKPKEEVGDK